MRLRAASSADVAAIEALIAAAYAKWVPLIGREPKPMTVDYARALVDHRIDLIEADGALCGLIEMAVEERALLIVNVAVAPDRQGQGLGRRLLAHAERVAAERGLARLRLYTNGLFTENIRLYERFGYRIDREETFPGGQIVHLSKPCEDLSRLRARVTGVSSENYGLY